MDWIQKKLVVLRCVHVKLFREAPSRGPNTYPLSPFLSLITFYYLSPLFTEKDYLYHIPTVNIQATASLFLYSANNRVPFTKCFTWVLNPLKIITVRCVCSNCFEKVLTDRFPTFSRYSPYTSTRETTTSRLKKISISFGRSLPLSSSILRVFNQLTSFRIVSPTK